MFEKEKTKCRYNQTIKMKIFKRMEENAAWKICNRGEEYGLELIRLNYLTDDP